MDEQYAKADQVRNQFPLAEPVLQWEQNRNHPQSARSDQLAACNSEKQCPDRRAYRRPFGPLHTQNLHRSTMQNQGCVQAIASICLLLTSIPRNPSNAQDEVQLCVVCAIHRAMPNEK